MPLPGVESKQGCHKLPGFMRQTADAYPVFRLSHR